MKPTFGSTYLDDNLPQFPHNTLYSFHVINRGYDINTGHCLRRVAINIRASKNISGLVKVSVTSPAGLMKFFHNVEPCYSKTIHHLKRCEVGIEHYRNVTTSADSATLKT